MLHGLFALALYAAAVPPLERAADVVTLAREGVSGAEIAARVSAAGRVFELTPEQAVRMYYDGVPAETLAALFATQGEGAPRVTGREAEVEILYPTFRVIGRRGASGPLLVVSGYARDGSRLAPAGEARPDDRSAELERETPVSARSRAPVVLEPEPAPLFERAPPRTSVYVPLEPEPRAEPITPYRSSRWGAPDYVSYTRVPAGWTQSATVVLPFGEPSYAAYGPHGYGPYAPYAFSGFGHSSSYGFASGGGGYVSYTLGPPQAQAAPVHRPDRRVVRDRIRR